MPTTNAPTSQSANAAEHFGAVFATTAFLLFLVGAFYSSGLRPTTPGEVWEVIKYTYFSLLTYYESFYSPEAAAAWASGPGAYYFSHALYERFIALAIALPILPPLAGLALCGAFDRKQPAAVRIDN